MGNLGRIEHAKSLSFTDTGARQNFSQGSYPENETVNVQGLQKPHHQISLDKISLREALLQPLFGSPTCTPRIVSVQVRRFHGTPMEDRLFRASLSKLS